MYASYTICIQFTIQKNVLNPKAPSDQPAFTPDQLLSFFARLITPDQLHRLPALKGKRFHDHLFTPLVTLWYLLFQRLHPNHTLDAAAADARVGGADTLNPRLSRELISAATTSFSDARQRIPGDLLAQALLLQGHNITALSPTTRWCGLVVALLDGSTVRLRPHGDIPKSYPPHHNQHRHCAYWCLMRVVVCFCALSGAALDCAIGSTHLSEQVLACEIILRATADCVFIGDRNFGVFRVIQAVRQAKQQALIRLTDVRAAKIFGRRLRLGDHAVCWKPTRHDQTKPGCSDEPVRGRLLVARIDRRGFRPIALCLFTTLTDPARYSLKKLAELYGARWHAEINLRYLKTQMDLVQLEVRSANMARKEWLAGLMAYNLIRAAMLCAAVRREISPLSLSFSATRNRLEYWLRHFGRTRRQARAAWQRTLDDIARCRLPRRSKPRPDEPRLQRHLRQPYGSLNGSRATARRRLPRPACKS